MEETIRTTKLREEIISKVLYLTGKVLNKDERKKYIPNMDIKDYHKAKYNDKVRLIIPKVCDEFGYDRPKHIETIMDLNEIGRYSFTYVKSSSSKWAAMELGDMIYCGEGDRTKMIKTASSARNWGQAQTPIRKFSVKRGEGKSIYMIRVN